MDKRKSLINVSVAIIFKVALTLLALLSKIFLVRLVSNGVNGLLSLYSSIIGFLSIAELGVGTAISYSMYGPVKRGEKEKIAALYQLFKKIYLIIGGIIAVIGLCLMPLLPYIVNGAPAGENLYLTFLVVLISAVIGYAFSAKSALIDAYKNNYVTTAIYSVSNILCDLFRILFLFLFKSFIIYLICNVVSVLLQWLLTEIYTRKKHAEILAIKAQVDKETKKEIVKNVKAMFGHKIGNIIVNSIDSIIISAFLSVAILGKYSNYALIATSMTGILGLFFTPLTAIIGHLYVEGNKEEINKVFKVLYLLNFVIGLIFFLGYYAIIDDVVSICFGGELLLGKEVSFIITLNYFIQFMRQTVIMFKDATGTFYYDRFKPIIEGVANIVLSILFAKFFGIIGVIVATIITNLFICHVIEPYVLHKHALKSSPKRYYILNYSLIVLFTALLIALHFCLQSCSDQITELFVNGFIAVAIGLVPIIIFICASKSFRQNVVKLFKSVLNLRHKTEEVVVAVEPQKEEADENDKEKT